MTIEQHRPGEVAPAIIDAEIVKPSASPTARRRVVHLVAPTPAGTGRPS